MRDDLYFTNHRGETYIFKNAEVFDWRLDINYENGADGQRQWADVKIGLRYDEIIMTNPPAIPERTEREATPARELIE